MTQMMIAPLDEYGYDEWTDYTAALIEPADFCRTCKGESLLTCTGCNGELGCLHSCERCEDEEMRESCHCDVCDDQGQISCPDC